MCDLGLGVEGQEDPPGQDYFLPSELHTNLWILASRMSSPPDRLLLSITHSSTDKPHLTLKLSWLVMVLEVKAALEVTFEHVCPRVAPRSWRGMSRSLPSLDVCPSILSRQKVAETP